MPEIPETQTIFRVRTSGWTYDHWKGRFYPANLPKSRWFEYYAACFSAVEVNATFYRTFQDQTYLNWKARAPQGFTYILKAPKTITHIKRLVDVEADIAAFWRSCANLGDRLDMILLQLAPSTPYSLERLGKTLRAFPSPHKIAIEFRHPSWLTQETENVLKSVNATFCNVDSPSQSLSGILTSDSAYLRLHGRDSWYASNYSKEALKEIARLAKKLVEGGARRVYIFFNNDFEGYAPANALDLIDLLHA